jgi:hypothetical protein
MQGLMNLGFSELLGHGERGLFAIPSSLWSCYQALRFRHFLVSQLSSSWAEYHTHPSNVSYPNSLPMLSATPSLTVSTSLVKTLPSLCPVTTIRPDSNGWVPIGTCGYISRPYYPSFAAALVFSTAAAAVLAGFAIRIVHHRRRRPDLLWQNDLFLPVFAAFTSTCLLAAYLSRTFGTKYQQVPEFVAFSDTLVLVCPICQSSVLISLVLWLYFHSYTSIHILVLTTMSVLQ